MYSELEQTYSGKNNENMLTAFFGWWFSDLPKKIYFIGTSYIKKLLRFFSLGVLAKTLFSPWKRDIINTRGMPLQERLQVWIMNLISRLIGFIIRLVTILVGLIFIAIVFTAFVLFLLIMLLMPLFIILVLILSLYG
jgi:hypothetical protein